MKAIFKALFLLAVVISVNSYADTFDGFALSTDHFVQIDSKFQGAPLEDLGSVSPLPDFMNVSIDNDSVAITVALNF